MNLSVRHTNVFAFLVFTVLLFACIRSFGLFLSTDELHVNPAPFTAFNDNPINFIDTDGKQPIYLSILKDASIPYVDGVIGLSYKDVNLKKIYNAAKYKDEPFLHPESMLPYNDIPFDGRLFFEAHGMGFSATASKEMISQHFMLGELTEEIKQITSQEVKSIHMLGCEASKGIRASNNRILGRTVKNRNVAGGIIRFRDVPEEVELFASPHMSMINELSPVNGFKHNSSTRTFLRINDSPVELYYESLMHPDFQNTPEHAQIFDRFRNGQYFPAERNYVGTWMNKFNPGNYTNLENWKKQVSESRVFLSPSELFKIP